MDSQARHPDEVIVQVSLSHEHAQRLVAEVQAEYVVRYGGEDATPLDPTEFEPPQGAFFVAYRDGEPVATGAWRRATTSRCSAPGGPLRSSGCTSPRPPAGSASLVGCSRASRMTAAAAGAEAMILETGTAQPEAMALYESSGYARIENFGHYKWSPQNRCYGKLLRVP